MTRRGEEANEIRRRDFFKLAAVAAASSAIGCRPRGPQEGDGLSSQTPPPQTKFRLYRLAMASHQPSSSKPIQVVPVRS